jgi:RIO kinase 1
MSEDEEVKGPRDGTSNDEGNEEKDKRGEQELEEDEIVLTSRLDSKVVEKALDQYSEYERKSRILRKNAEEAKVFEEVFDRDTLLILYDMMNSGTMSYLNGVVSAGKESRVYWGVTKEGEDIAVKIYLVSSVEFRKRLPYLMGDPRFHRIRKNTRDLVELWARKEFVNLKTAYESDIWVPQPFDVKGNVLAMEFIGKKGVPSPRLIDSGVVKSDFRKIVTIARKLLVKSHLVHADLSEYNIFKPKSQGELILFDFGSAVDLKHPMAKRFLERDITNITRFFERRGITVPQSSETFQKVAKGIEF